MALTAHNTSLIYQKSELNTLINIFKKYNQIAGKMQKNIIKQDWEKVLEISENQQEINNILDDTLKSLNHIDGNDSKEIINLKIQLKELIIKYKETERININLLNDNLFISQVKVNKFFNKKNEKKTYSNKAKKESNLWNNKPVMLDSFA